MKSRPRHSARLVEQRAKFAERNHLGLRVSFSHTRHWSMSHFSLEVLGLCRPALSTAQIQETVSQQICPGWGQELGLSF